MLMNQFGFVEISIIKNEKLFRAQLPLGVPWTDVREALNEMLKEVEDHIKAIEAQKEVESES